MWCSTNSSYILTHFQITWGNGIVNRLALTVTTSLYYIHCVDHWLVNQHWIWQKGLGDTQRQARDLISGPCLSAKARLLSFNRTQSRAVTGLLSFNRTQSRAVTGLLIEHNTLGRHLHLLGLLDSPQKVWSMEEASAHIFCESEALASPRHGYLGSFFLEPQDINSKSLGAIWNFSKATGLT